MGAPEDWGNETSFGDVMTGIGDTILLCVGSLLFLPIAAFSSIDTIRQYKKLDKFLDVLESHGYIIKSDSNLTDITTIVKDGKKSTKVNDISKTYELYIIDKDLSDMPFITIECSCSSWSTVHLVIKAQYEDNHITAQDMMVTRWFIDALKKIVDYLDENGHEKSARKFEECVAEAGF